MSPVLPDHPNLEHLKGQARALQRALRGGDPAALQRYHDAGTNPTPALATAQHVIAREYGFATWAALKEHVASRRASPADAFIAAIRRNDADQVARLLREHPALSAVVNRGTDDLGFGATPLIGAVQRGNRAMVDTLLAAGADLRIKSDWWAGGFSALESAAPDLAPFLLERGAVLDAVAAARFGMVEALAELIDRDPAAVHQRSGDGKTPLHWAANVPTARLLVERGADVDARDVDHESTAVQYAIGDRQDVARYLIDAGASADIFAAAALGDLVRVREIVDREPGAVNRAINARDFPMKNPRAGGTIYIWTLGQGKSPHVVAHDFKHGGVLAFLVSRSSDELNLAQACLLGDEALFARFVASRATRAAPLTLSVAEQLVQAAMDNNLHAVRLMLRAGWPVGVQPPGGATALHWAAWHGNVELVREILAHKPPLDARDAMHHGTPLGWALHGSLHGWHRNTGDYGGVVTALIGAGAPIGQSPDDAEGSETALAALKRGVAATTPP